MQARQDLGVALGFFVGENGTGTGVTIQSSEFAFKFPGSAGGTCSCAAWQRRRPGPALASCDTVAWLVVSSATVLRLDANLKSLWARSLGPGCLRPCIFYLYYLDTVQYPDLYTCTIFLLYSIQICIHVLYFYYSYHSNLRRLKKKLTMH